MAQNEQLIERIEKFFEKEKELSSKVFRDLTWYIFSREKEQHDLYLLAELLSKEDLNKLVEYYDGEYLKLPTKEQYRECYLLSICYYLKVIKGMSWDEIKKLFDLPEINEDMISSISLGTRINKINNEVTEEMKELLGKINFEGKL